MLRRASTLLLPLVALLGCAEGQPRDNTGQRMEMRALSAADTAAFPLNVSAFLPASSLSDFRRSERDGQAAYVDTLNHRGVQALHYQWLRGQLIFATRTYREIANREIFDGKLARSGLPVAPGRGVTMPVRHNRYPSVGYTFVGPGQAEGAMCFFGVAAYGVKVQSSETQGLETADAVLTGGLCGRGLDTDAFVRLFNGFVATAP